MFGFFFVIIQYLQLVQGYSALGAALAIIPMSVVMIPLATVAATLAERYGQRVIGALGLALSAIGMGYFVSLGVSSNYLPARRDGRAGGGHGLGGAFGVAMVGSAFNVGYRGEIDSQLSRFPAEVAEGAKESPAIALDASRGPGGQGSLLADLTRDSFMVGMRWAVVLGSALLLVGAAYVWLRGSAVEATEEEDLLDLTDGDAEIDVALAPAPAE